MIPKCPKCKVDMFYSASMTIGKQTWENRDQFDECPNCGLKIKRTKEKA